MSKFFVVLRNKFWTYFVQFLLKLCFSSTKNLLSSNMIRCGRKTGGRTQGYSLPSMKP
jgi:hypothetical protein